MNRSIASIAFVIVLLAFAVAGTGRADPQRPSLNDRVLIALAHAGSFEATATTSTGTRITTIVTQRSTRVSLVSHATHIETVKMVSGQAFARINGSDWYEIAGRPMYARVPTPTPVDITRFVFQSATLTTQPGPMGSFVATVTERTESLFGALIPTIDPGATIACTYGMADMLPRTCTSGGGRAKLVVTFTKWNAMSPDDDGIPEVCRDGGFFTHNNPHFTMVSDVFNLLPCSATTTEHLTLPGHVFDRQEIDWFEFPKFAFGQRSRIHVLDTTPARNLAAGQSVTLVCSTGLVLLRPDDQFANDAVLFFSAGTTLNIVGPPIPFKTYYAKDPISFLQIDPHAVSPLAPQTTPVIAPDCAVPTSP